MLIEPSGATVVINHHVKLEKISQYELWLTQISEAATHAPGLLDWQIIRPIPSITTTYSILLRFESIQRLEQWMKFQVLKNWKQFSLLDLRSILFHF